MKKYFFTLTTLIPSTFVFSQALPPIFTNTPRKILKSEILISYPKNTWLENMAKGSDSALYLTDYPSGNVYRVTTKGAKALYANIKGKIAGIVQSENKSFLVTGWDDESKPGIFKIDENRNVIKLLNISSGQFPNGILALSPGKFLIADSYAGCIWEYDAVSNSMSVWLSDSLLARTSPDSKFPAANGLKRFKNNLYVSNTEKQILVEIPMQHLQAGKAFLYLNKLNIDDFDFDEKGNIYAATNVYNLVIKITPEKRLSVIADLGSGVAGCTAVVYDKSESKQSVLYVSTNGGMAAPPSSGVEEGKVVKIFLP
jgi:SMP-30/Gluconolactonase/LRE-like region